MDDELQSKQPLQKRWNPSAIKIIAISAGTTLLVMILAMIIVFNVLPHNNNNAQNDNYKSYAKLVTFNIVAPRETPAGFYIDKSSSKAEAGNLTLVYKDATDRRVVLSEQPTPQGFDAGRFVPEKEFTTTQGKAYIVQFNGRMTGILVSNGTLAYITSLTDDSALVEAFLRSF
jgi:hypothetical protein